MFIATFASTALVIAPVLGQTPARIRGTITAIDVGRITVKERDGRIVTLKSGSYTTYGNVVQSSLDAIKVNDFVGSAVKGPLSSMVAVELAIIPKNMQAGRISLYKWDPLPDPTAVHTSDMTETNMTNGLVSNVSTQAKAFTHANDSAGSLAAENTGADGLTLTVAYDGGSKRFRITVPPNAPIVRYILSDRSTVAIGSVVMIKTNPGDRAGLVTVGKGVTPPM
jgi:hypothetical protein